MAEISLNAYQDRLASFLSEGRYNEVTAHARHILKAYPKNLRAYEQLGDALFATGRGAEAADVIRRMLGARPHDFKANSQLAQVYQQMGQGQRALRHAELAFDQRPNHRETIDLIRRLTLEQHGEQIERMQLTVGALAQQYMRNSSLPDALEILNGALERNPGRVDLQLLRARCLWLDGQRMAAAESADEVLRALPNSITVNRIMAELWLSERRPSDAQAYLARIKALDPYLAHQLTTSEIAPEDLFKLEELDYDSMPRHEQAIVNPDWLDSLRESEAEADGSALFDTDAVDGEGTEKEFAVAAPPTATADLDDLLADDEIENLFKELIADESDGSAPNAGLDHEHDVVAALKEQGFMVPASFVEKSLSMPVTSGEQERNEGDMDDDLARVLEKLEADDDGDNSWVMDIQHGDGESDDDESQQYVKDFDRDWLLEPEPAEEAAGAPWLSAAMREMMTESEESDEFDLFADDEQLQHLLNRTSDTEPIQVDDIQSWLDQEELNLAETDPDAVAGLDDLDDELLVPPPVESWLDEEIVDEPAVEQPVQDEPISVTEQNQLNANLIDSWQSELEDDDDDDPYVDWLSEDTAAGIDEELGIFAVDEEQAAAGSEAMPDPILDLDESPAAETARAWGLEDQNQLADFVEDELRLGDAEAVPSWLNATAPGLDRVRDAEPEKESEFAKPDARPQQEFDWVSDIVQEETGEMEAIQEPVPQASTLYFRFTKPPTWLSAMQAESLPNTDGGDLAPFEAVAALSVAEDIDELELDDLTFDDYFNFDMPTDKMDAINLDDSGDGINFSELGWDDYFEFDSPTEKTIAITLDEEANDMNFQGLGIEDEDFDFDTPTDKMPAITLKEELDPLEFEDIGLDEDADAKDLTADDRDKRGGGTLI